MARQRRMIAMSAVAVSSLILGSAASAEGDFTVTINVSGWIDRTVAVIDLGDGSPVEVTGVSWSVTLTAVGTAWLSDGWFGLGEPLQPPQVVLIPGIDDPFPGTAFYGGSLKFEDVGLPNVQLSDGWFQLGFLTSGQTVVIKEESFVTVQYSIVPAPAVLPLVGLAVAGMRRRRAL